MSIQCICTVYMHIDISLGNALVFVKQKPQKLFIFIHAQERIMTSFLFGREEEERVTSYSGRGESRIFRMYYK